MSKVTLSIEYAGLQLQIAKDDQGQDVTALKPITDLFGLQWERQRKKITESPYFSKFFGVCTVPMYGAGTQKREQTCILLSRVAAFLMSLSPDQVRAQGNIFSADFLEAKIEEWADALHDYEQLGAAINLNHAKNIEALRKQRMSLAQMIGIKNKTPEISDRKAIGHIIKQMADELDVPYQLDLLDGQ